MTKRPSSPAREDGQADLFGGGAPAPALKKARAAKAGRAAAQPALADQSSRPTAPDALLNVRQAAVRLGLSKSTLDKMRGAGKGPRFIKSSTRAIRYDPADLDAWINARRSTSSSA